MRGLRSALNSVYNKISSSRPFFQCARIKTPIFLYPRHPHHVTWFTAATEPEPLIGIRALQVKALQMHIQSCLQKRKAPALADTSISRLV